MNTDNENELGRQGCSGAQPEVKLTLQSDDVRRSLATGTSIFDRWEEAEDCELVLLPNEEALSLWIKNNPPMYSPEWHETKAKKNK